MRVSATRDRVTPARIPGRPPLVSLHDGVGLTRARARNGSWSGGIAVDVADSLIDAQTPEARERFCSPSPSW